MQRAVESWIADQHIGFSNGIKRSSEDRIWPVLSGEML